MSSKSTKPGTTLAALFILYTFVAVFDPQLALGQTVDWIRQFGTAGADPIRAIASDEEGHIYVVGETNGAFAGATNAGGWDVWIRKFDARGEVIWTRQFGTAGNDFVGTTSGGLAVAHGGVYVGGYTNGAYAGYTSAGGFDAFLRRYSTDGTEEWTTQFGTAGFDDIHDVAVDEPAGVYVAGSVIGQLPGQQWAGGSDGYLRRYDSAGNVMWTYQFGTAGLEHLNAIAFDDTGAYAVGHTNATLPGQVSAGSLDVYVQRYSREGELKWTRQFGSAAVDVPQSVAADQGGIYVVGRADGALPGETHFGSGDAFVRRYQPGGEVTWTRQFGTTGFDQVIGVAVRGRALLVAGAVSGPLPDQTYAGGIRDAFVRQYDPLFGDEEWTYQFGTPVFDSAFDVAVAAGGSVYVGGVTNGSFPGNTNSGALDAYLMKLTTAN